jgi:hypothetical protein
MTGADRQRRPGKHNFEIRVRIRRAVGEESEEAPDSPVQRRWGRGWVCYGKNTVPVERSSRIRTETDGEDEMRKREKREKNDYLELT